MKTACHVHVRGVIQGVGFRPFVYRLARRHELAGWVFNSGEGVDIHIEGDARQLAAFTHELRAEAPAAASIATLVVRKAEPCAAETFVIRQSGAPEHPSTGISPDLPTCDNCLRDLFDANNPRAHYPYINCTECGPRYSVIKSLPYDRASTTMSGWPMDDACASEYGDPSSRFFHAQPVACPKCGPIYRWRHDTEFTRENGDALHAAAIALTIGAIVAVKSLGGYHLACDARNAEAVALLRARKFRKEKPFAVMVRDLDVAATLADLSQEAVALLGSTARPIVLVPCRTTLAGVAPGHDTVGLMLPYTPVHHLLFAAAAPSALVMTSANRSSEPIAYLDDDAATRLRDIADAFLVGDRPIARRVEDSVARAGVLGPVIMRRSRGYAPGAVATIPCDAPLLALGADLKSAVTLVVDGQAFVSQHLGDLAHYDAYRAFDETVDDLLRMYDVNRTQLLVVRDAHPQYHTTQFAERLHVKEVRTVQHHRAHIASVLAERGAWEQRVVGVALDGAGYGDDNTVWGGELFVGSVADGFARVMHLRPATLVGGDAASAHPVQAAAGFLHQLDDLPQLQAPPFNFPSRYSSALRLLRSGTRCFRTTSVGRLFDTAAALLGFTRELTFEGQAAIWLEQMAHSSGGADPYPFPIDGAELDFRPLLRAVVRDRLRGRDAHDVARAFHAGLAHGLHDAVLALCERHATDVVVLSGGVFQNEVLMRHIVDSFHESRITPWCNHLVPANDGGISLGQAALAAFSRTDAPTEAMRTPVASHA